RMPMKTACTTLVALALCCAWLLPPEAAARGRGRAAAPRCRTVGGFPIQPLVLIPAAAAEEPEVRFDVNDISFLWPVPKTKADVDRLISVDEKLADGDNSFLSQAAFDALIKSALDVRVNDSAGRPQQINFAR